MKQRVQLIAAALALTSACWAHSPQDDPMQKKISLNVPATTAKNLMPILQKETGLPFNTTPQTANDVLLVSVKDVTVQQLLDKIAEADDAEWVKDSAGYRLSRSQSLSNKLDREYLQARANALQDAIAKVQKPSTSEGEAEGAKVTGTVSFDEGNGPQEFKMPPIPKLTETPVGRALLNVLGHMNVNELASIGEGARIVYATNPTRMQRAMPGAAVRDLQNFAKEHQRYVEQKRQAETEVPPVNFIMFGPNSQTSKDLKGGVQKVLLVIQRMHGSEDLMCTLYVADMEGNFAATASTNLSGEIKNEYQPLPVNGHEDSISLSDEAKLHAKLMESGRSSGNVNFVSLGGNAMFFTTELTAVGGSSQGQQEKPKPTPELLAKILQPEKYDPLSFAVSELISGLAQGDNGNLVASLPDSLLIPLSRRAATNTRPSDLVNILQSNYDMKIAAKDGWTMVTPRFSPVARYEQSERLPVGQLLRTVNGKKAMSLDDMAGYAFRRGLPLPNNNWETPYLTIINKSAGPELAGQSSSNWNILRLYGSMNVQQRRDMLQVGRVRAGNLNPAQSAIFDSMIYDDPMGPVYFDPNPQPQNNNRKVQEMITVSAISSNKGGGFFMMSETKLINERTELLPVGVPREAILHLTVNVKEAVLAMTADESQSQYMTADDYAMRNWMASQNGGKMPMEMPKFEKFIPATITDLNFDFNLSQFARMFRSLKDEATNPSRSAVPYQQLPSTFQDAVRAATERMQQKMQNAPGVRIGGGGKKPPPQA